MRDRPHLLLLAGSGEARRVATCLADGPAKVTASLFRDDHWSGALPVPTRFGGFGGDAGFARFLTDQQVTAVLDATHPFACRISARSWRVCHTLNLPFLQLDRPAWTQKADETWTEVSTPKDAARCTNPGDRVFVTTGRQTCGAFTELPDRTFFFRQLTQDPALPCQGRFRAVPGQGPFTIEQERHLFETLKINRLICKNSGGAASRTKLDAAREMKVPIILLRRPAPSGAPVVSSVSDALDWVMKTCR